MVFASGCLRGRRPTGGRSRGGSAARGRWSSPRSHLGAADKAGMLDMDWRQREGLRDWEQVLGAGEAKAGPPLATFIFAPESS